ncbi:MAG: DUF86 domain-containing protein [Patescibacteria group bacterium]
MTKEMRVYLDDILESIGKIEEYTRGLTLTAFERDIQRQDAVMRRPEIIGEAVKHLPEATRTHYPDIPWQQIAGMRDILIHEYSSVSLDRVWNVVTDHLADLKHTTQEILQKMYGDH